MTKKKTNKEKKTLEFEGAKTRADKLTFKTTERASIYRPLVEKVKKALTKPGDAYTLTVPKGIDAERYRNNVGMALRAHAPEGHHYKFLHTTDGQVAIVLNEGRARKPNRKKAKKEKVATTNMPTLKTKKPPTKKSKAKKVAPPKKPKPAPESLDEGTHTSEPAPAETPAQETPADESSSS